MTLLRSLETHYYYLPLWLNSVLVAFSCFPSPTHPHECLCSFQVSSKLTQLSDIVMLSVYHQCKEQGKPCLRKICLNNQILICKLISTYIEENKTNFAHYQTQYIVYPRRWILFQDNSC
ncbi:hypothetical protein PanWU01x14_136180 [Parasponia andersonii]|uniref:Uncharacterized protein n=1 Tax=Parasponia andersonii TaxID=3476 RepID=A0A2P5CNW9_PARAD|nr:hypothetical protein PanWU01x14_136180 [Parasponia andersonii]